MLVAYQENIAVGGIKAVYIDFPWDFGYHWHLDFEIIYVKKGRQRVMLSQNMVDLSEGEVLVVAPGEIHSYLNEEGRSEVFIAVIEQTILHNLGLSEREKEMFLKFFCSTKKAHYTYPKEVKEYLDTLCRDIHLEQQAQKVGYVVAQNAYVYQFITTIFRNLEFEDLSELGDGIFKEKYNKLLPVFNYINDNYSQPITLDDAASLVHFSKYYFCKLFKEVTETTFIDYLNSVRIEKAQKELINSKNSMTQISLEVGFNSVDSFNKAFKQVCHCTPTEFRKNYSGK